jgi:hypothetical protein
MLKTSGPGVFNDKPSWPFWRPCAIFLVAAAALLASNWTAIRAVNIESWDFAANTLLVLDAKNGGLLKGNYSRVGFNHPGPAILYVLAGGELLLHDWLQLVPSPFSGQLAATALYNAFWITLLFGLARATTRSASAGALALACLLLTLAILERHSFAGPWFPHLYMLPFAVFLAAAARLACAEPDALWPLSLSAGFLTNGHASFLSILGITLLAACAGNLLLRRTRDRDKLLLGRAFLTKNRQRLLLALALLALFFVPLLLETLKHPPGPLATYMAFAKQRTPNSLSQAFTYVAQYWGGSAPLLAGVAGLLLTPLLLGRAPRQVRDAVVGLVSVLLGATLATLFYAVYGVDHLDQTYIGLFYYLAPAMSAALAASLLCGLLPATRRTLLAWTFTGLILTLSLALISEKHRYAHRYHAPAVAELYGRLETLATRGRVVLEMDLTQGGDVWANLVGAEVYAKRRGKDLFCVKNWHIIFTGSARCAPEELANNEQFLVAKQSPRADSGPEPAFRSADLVFYRGDPRPLFKK